MRLRLGPLLTTCVLPPFVLAGTVVQPLTLQKVLQQMDERDRLRSASLIRYTCMRRYTLDNRRFHTRAELRARMTYNYPGYKKFEVSVEQGSSVIRQRVLRRMLEAEEEASRDEVREHTRITPLNYEFQLLAVQVREGRALYVLKVAPKVQNKFLIRGRIWVDGEDFAIVRVEAAPAQNPSTWIRNTHVVQQYAKFCTVWLPLSSHSEADSFVFGRTVVTIESSEYEITLNKANTCVSLNAERPEAMISKPEADPKFMRSVFHPRARAIITMEARENRAQEIKIEVANARLQGLEPIPEFFRLADQYVAGELTLNQFSAAIHRLDPHQERAIYLVEQSPDGSGDA